MLEVFKAVEGLPGGMVVGLVQSPPNGVKGAVA